MYFPWIEQRINKLHTALDLSTYLEIGLGTGDTYNKVQIPNKVGIDNRLVPQVPDQKHMTSDEYFRLNWDNPIKFDLIFIDGDHKVESAYRDFTNSIRFSHDKTIWILDDTVPIDVFSTMRSAEEAFALRGSTEGGWHGDVYKLVWLIRAFHQNFKVMTIGDHEWKQTFLYQQAGASSYNGTLAEIASLTYTDTLKKENEYNFLSEEAVLASCIDFVKS